MFSHINFRQTRFEAKKMKVHNSKPISQAVVRKDSVDHRVVKSAGVVISMVSIQNLLAPLFCLLGKTLYGAFSYFMVLSLFRQEVLNFSHISIKLNNQNKKFQRDRISWHFRKQVGIIVRSMY